MRLRVYRVSNTHLSYFSTEKKKLIRGKILPKVKTDCSALEIFCFFFSSIAYISVLAIYLNFYIFFRLSTVLLSYIFIKMRYSGPKKNKLYSTAVTENNHTE